MAYLTGNAIDCRCRTNRLDSTFAGPASIKAGHLETGTVLARRKPKLLLLLACFYFFYFKILSWMGFVSGHLHKLGIGGYQIHRQTFFGARFLAPFFQALKQQLLRLVQFSQFFFFLQYHLVQYGNLPKWPVFFHKCHGFYTQHSFVEAKLADDFIRKTLRFFIIRQCKYFYLHGFS